VSTDDDHALVYANGDAEFVTHPCVGGSENRFFRPGSVGCPAKRVRGTSREEVIVYPSTAGRTDDRSAPVEGNGRSEIIIRIGIRTPEHVHLRPGTALVRFENEYSTCIVADTIVIWCTDEENIPCKSNGTAKKDIRLRGS
jgi:hypothetical protein